MKGLLLTVLGLAIFVVAVLYFCQGRFIYFPRKYHSSMEGLAHVEAFSFRSEHKEQILLIPNRESDSPPKRIWWIFGGNGSVALDWLGLVESVENPDVAFVLFDYPGYGFNEGRPSPERITRSINSATHAVARKFRMSKTELMRRSSTTGQSLGCAFALYFADNHKVNQVIAIAPFTTMEAMARQQMGPAVVPLLRHRYDNEKTIDNLLASGREIDVTIYHGDADNIIPDSMGRELAARDKAQSKIQFVSVPGAGHNNIMGSIAPELVRIWGESQ